MDARGDHDDHSDNEDIFLDALSGERDSDSVSDGTIDDLLGDSDSDAGASVHTSDHSNQGMGDLGQQNVLLSAANFSDSLNDLLKNKPGIILISDSSDPEYDGDKEDLQGDSEQEFSDPEDPHYKPLTNLMIWMTKVRSSREFLKRKAYQRMIVHTHQN